MKTEPKLQRLLPSAWSAVKCALAFPNRKCSTRTTASSTSSLIPRRMESCSVVLIANFDSTTTVKYCKYIPPQCVWLIRCFSCV
ncbi:hypothetical protein L596_005501 [Steinernema carpocapsae]|uniref:Uncharacterized protein n=1 Tax=Steinernema carpocapsae TaxID=34508 RepID=A0A4U8UZG6_STECR|nr:hypothetical protein L596_005501 [Steinernema carpocapsae]